MKKFMNPSCLLLFFFIFSLFIDTSYSEESRSQLDLDTNEKIIGIETSSFFTSLSHDYKEVFYVYFGRPTCLECIEFQAELEAFLEQSNWVVYYYNTAYWKDDPSYNRILSKYHVDSVPLLVKISSGEFEAAFIYDSSLSSDEIQSQLNNFFIPLSSGLFATTEKSFPIQFHTRLSAIAGLFLFINLLYLFMTKKELIQKKPRFTILLVFLTSSIATLLQFFIFSLGMSFALAYEASPANDILSRIGRISYMLSIPLYISICFFCIYIKGKQLQFSENQNY